MADGQSRSVMQKASAIKLRKEYIIMKNKANSINIFDGLKAEQQRAEKKGPEKKAAARDLDAEEVEEMDDGDEVGEREPKKMEGHSIRINLTRGRKREKKTRKGFELRPDALKALQKLAEYYDISENEAINQLLEMVEFEIE